MQLVSIGETAAELGVAIGTLRRRHRQGLLMPLGRTVGGHRPYQRDTVRATLGAEPAVTGKTVCYARVSSHAQAPQLQTQAARLEKHCLDAGFTDIEIVTELGTGLAEVFRPIRDKTNAGRPSRLSAESIPYLANRRAPIFDIVVIRF